MVDESQTLTDNHSRDEAPLPSDPDLHVVSAVAPSGVRLFGYHLPTNLCIAIGSFTIIALGILLGFTVTPPSQDPSPWDRVSAVIGWWYFNAWSISFLPQLYLNFVRGSVVGQSFDYVFLNVLGFFSYSIYTICFYFVKEVQEQYHDRYGNDNNVDPNDVGFAVYAFVCCVYNSYQIWRYDRGGQTVSKWTLGGIAITVSVMTLWIILIACGVHKDAVFNSLDFLYGLSIVKLAVSLIKYVPQVYLNFKRKCTVGWNIYNVLLDFTGGSLSVTQQLIDCGTTGNWNGIAGNPVKFALGTLSMIYDIMFMVQHFILYKENNERMHRQQLAETYEDDDATA